jgi:hypothetical protein
MYTLENIFKILEGKSPILSHPGDAHEHGEYAGPFYNPMRETRFRSEAPADL